MTSRAFRWDSPLVATLEKLPGVEILLWNAEDAQRFQAALIFARVIHYWPYTPPVEYTDVHCAIQKPLPRPRGVMAALTAGVLGAGIACLTFVGVTLLLRLYAWLWHWAWS